MKLIISCEHASAAVPDPYQGMFEDRNREVLWSHRGWDPGALALARELSVLLDVPVIKGEWTRLLLDLNRSPDNPDRWSEFSRSLVEEEREALHLSIFTPFWEKLFGTVESLILESERVIHLSVHSFVRILNHKQRVVDVGVLFDPARSMESEFSSRLVSNLNLLRKDSLNILENVPYAGTEDGLTRLLREKFPDASYAGIEIEVCSDLLEDNKSIRRMAVDLSQGICQSLVDL